MTKKSFTNLFLSMSIMGLGLLASCQLFKERIVPVVASKGGSYGINPRIILDELSQGQVDVFKPQAATPDSRTTQPYNSVQWRQLDYLHIAQVLHYYVWKEPLQEWKLDSIVFSLLCSEAVDGPQRGGFLFFKVLSNVENQPYRITHDISISPNENSVKWTEIEYSSELSYTRMIDLSQVKIPVEEALKIAERNGGQNARISVQNKCDIFLALAPGSIDDGWQVGYSMTDNKELFTIYIDPAIGKFRVVTPTGSSITK
jgi:hypothetical protein